MDSDRVIAVRNWLENVDMDEFVSDFKSIVAERGEMVFEPHLQKALNDARESLANADLDELLSDFLAFEGCEDSGERSLFNQVLDEYLRATGIQWRYWDNNEYEFCVHLMNEYGIGAKPVTDATWEAECNCYMAWGSDLMEAVFKCYLDYAKDVGDGVDK